MVDITRQKIVSVAQGAWGQAGLVYGYLPRVGSGVWDFVGHRCGIN
jgi:hypothetical protein